MSGLTIRVLEENLSVDTTRSDQGRVERLNLVRSHDDLDVTTVVKTIELIEELQHGSLNLALTSRSRFVSFCADSVDLVDEDNGGCVLGSGLEQLSY